MKNCLQTKNTNVLQKKKIMKNYIGNRKNFFTAAAENNKNFIY